MEPNNLLELDEKERAYRRGALQAIQYVIKDITYRVLDNPESHWAKTDVVRRIAEWEQQLLLNRDSLDPRYLGKFMDAIKEDVANATKRKKEEGTTETEGTRTDKKGEGSLRQETRSDT